MTSKLLQALDAPWKARNGIFRVLLYPAARLYFAWRNVCWGKGWRIYGLPSIQHHRGSRIEIGDRLNLRSWSSSNPLTPNHPVVLCTWFRDSEIVIGEDFGMTGGTICAFTSVRIGDRVNIGANATIADTDFHSLNPERRRKRDDAVRSLPVVIESDVFIGMNAIILKGVRVGSGSVIGAGSVVARDVPPGTIWAGNPAREVAKTPPP